MKKSLVFIIGIGVMAAVAQTVTVVYRAPQKATIEDNLPITTGVSMAYQAEVPGTRVGPSRMQFMLPAKPTVTKTEAAYIVDFPGQLVIEGE